ncbi:MAG TPA: hypothetical protein VND93_33855 [Myxococcales bacterium]|nr:hypothetical protein [Myxococcales bacterium]
MPPGDVSPRNKPSTPCPQSTNCPLYPQFALHSILRYWRFAYCDSDYARCARYQLAAGGQPVPMNLLPSGSMMKPK